MDGGLEDGYVVEGRDAGVLEVVQEELLQVGGSQLIGRCSSNTVNQQREVGLQNPVPKNKIK